MKFKCLLILLMFVNLLLAVDSDSDGVSDEVELSMGTNPNNGQEYDGLVNESGQFSYAFNLHDDWTKYLIDYHQAEVRSEGASRKYWKPTVKGQEGYYVYQIPVDRPIVSAKLKAHIYAWTLGSDSNFDQNAYAHLEVSSDGVTWHQVDHQYAGVMAQNDVFDISEYVNGASNVFVRSRLLSTFGSLIFAQSLRTSQISLASFMLVINIDQHLAPFLELETFYESNSGESITIDATPTDGYPTTYTYQWSYKAVGSNSYFTIPSNFGGTASTFQILGDPGNNGTWKVKVTNDTGSTTEEFNYRVYNDSDNDGLSDGQEEFVLGTDPNDNDSDDDTLLDGVETNTGTWISTSDTGTDPLSNDSDGDGLSDGYELSLSEFSIIQIDSNNWYDAKLDAENRGGSLAILNTEERINQANDYLSNRVTWDNLWIGLKYNTEQQQFEWVNNEALTSSNWDVGEPNNVELGETVVYIHPSYAANPLKWNNHAVVNSQTNTYLLETIADPNNPDTDGDGLLDGVETGSGTYINSFDTGTSLLNADSDSDGIIDGYETATGTWQSPTDTGTNPNSTDSDGDTLSDTVETNSGTYVSLADTGTNPNSTDSDGDGFTDDYEINTSYDPTNSEDAPDAVLVVKTAIELEFHGASGGTYRIEHSTDLGSWTTVEDNIQGESALVERLHPIDDYNRRFFRVIRTDQ